MFGNQLLKEFPGDGGCVMRLPFEGLDFYLPFEGRLP
jgi:hypothetical protein